MAASPNWTGPETTSPRSRSNRAPAPPVAGRIERMPLPFGPPGTERSLLVRRYGQPGARPKAYIQAGLHADEIPGLLVAQRLAALLEDVTVLGEVLLVPVANPIGLDQRVLGAAVGRYALDHGSNFNRGFTALEEPVARRVTGRLGADATANVRLIREAMSETLRATAPADALAGWRQALLTLAVDADIVLDLHCDQDSVLHLYTGASLWPVKNTLLTLKKNGALFEIVNLVVPGLNDGRESMTDMIAWIKKDLGTDVPLFFSRFAPNYQLAGIGVTPAETLTWARNAAIKQGLKYVYVGNIPGHEGENTYCPVCGRILVKRYGYAVLDNQLTPTGGRCPHDGTKIPGIW